MKPNEELRQLKSECSPEFSMRFGAILYQVNTPEVTTMGACRNGCGRLARGAATCPDCLAGDQPFLKRVVRCAREIKLEAMERREREARPWRG